MWGIFFKINIQARYCHFGIVKLKLGSIFPSREQSVLILSFKEEQFDSYSQIDIYF